MQVENYTVDLMGQANIHGQRPLKQIDGSIAKRKAERMIRDAKRHYLDGYDIEWANWHEPELIFQDMLTCDITWVHKTSGRRLCLSLVYWDEQTGAIIQAGTNYGNLTL